MSTQLLIANLVKKEPQGSTQEEWWGARGVRTAVVGLAKHAKASSSNFRAEFERCRRHTLAQCNAVLRARLRLLRGRGGMRYSQRNSAGEIEQLT